MKKTLNVLAVAAVFALAGSTYSAGLAVPHTFSSGTTIKSSEVNENFSILYQKINKMQATIDRLSGYHIPTNGLVAYYPFNGNANDESGNGNNGITNGPSLDNDRFGSINSAYSFDGNNDYISTTFNPTNFISNGNSYSISVWVNLTSVTETQLILGNTVSDAAFNMSVKYIGPESYSFAWTLGNEGYTPHQNVSLGTWHNVVLIFNGNEHSLWINSLINTTKEYSGNGVIGSNSIYLGNDSDNNNRPLSGKLDEVRIYDRALSPTEVQTIFRLEKTCQNMCQP